MSYSCDFWRFANAYLKSKERGNHKQGKREETLFLNLLD